MANLFEAGRRLLKANWELIEGDWQPDQALGIPPPPQERPPREGQTLVPLRPVAELAEEGGAFLSLIRSRKSRRKFAAAELSEEALSLLCWAAAGIREHRPKYSFRTFPSGGARHPLDLYVYLARARGLEPGLYRYLPIEHALVLEKPGLEAGALEGALHRHFWDPAAVFIWAALPYRTEWRYGPVAHKLILLDAGHACQNLYLACESLGLGTCAVGAYDQAGLDSWLGLDGEEEFAVYAAPVGKPAD